MHDLFIMHPALPSRPKAAIALALGQVDKNLSDGADEELQLLDLALRIKKACKAG
jgi:replication factor C subunit 2/4